MNLQFTHADLVTANSPHSSSNDNVPIEDLTDNDIRTKLKKHIAKKTTKITDKLQYVSLKYDIVKTKFNNYSLTILIVSALITLSDALKLLIIQFIGKNNLSINSNDIDFILNILSLMMGTYMTVLASIIRFQNYREKMEKLKEMQDKLIHMKALYNRELANLRLNKNEEKTLVDEVQDKLSEYDIIIDEINIISEISNNEMILFSEKISKFKLKITNIKNNENIQLKELLT
jgi:uncharacterized integral membrane protein|tara:strand:- start:425 stop:1120 length:696 start_codon:yes stop_codon:yes gene_type:complete